jgi:tRNA U34 5-methylaminomethyl-2-thiouridine-forming methyltransferase MnmC
MKVERRIVKTADGSATLQLPHWQEQYHSMHGALQEAYHVFISKGLDCYNDSTIHILEMGFGTGLNALISLLEAPARKLQISYTALEAYPVTEAEWTALDYGNTLQKKDAPEYFRALHKAPWEEVSQITPFFKFHKKQQRFEDFSSTPCFDLVYFDAFGARVQPDLWTEEIFATMFAALVPGGRLVTYAAKGSVRRAMQAVGFIVERLPGPPGKREMLRATRPDA